MGSLDLLLDTHPLVQSQFIVFLYVVYKSSFMQCSFWEIMPKCGEVMAEILQKCAKNVSPLIELIILENLSLMMSLGCNTTHRKVRKGSMKFIHEKITHNLHEFEGFIMHSCMIKK